MGSFTKFEIGDQIVIDAENADRWANIIGRPLADAIKAAPKGESENIVVTSVDHHTKIITYARVAKVLK